MNLPKHRQIQNGVTFSTSYDPAEYGNPITHTSRRSNFWLSVLLVAVCALGVLWVTK